MLMLYVWLCNGRTPGGTENKELRGYLSAGLLACALSSRQRKALLLVGLGAAALVGLSCLNCAIGIEDAACTLLVSNHPDSRWSAG